MNLLGYSSNLTFEKKLQFVPTRVLVQVVWFMFCFLTNHQNTIWLTLANLVSMKSVYLFKAHGEYGALEFLLSVLNFYCLLYTLTNTMTIFYYSGYGTSSTSSQMDREHSSKPSAKALYGMFIYLMRI